MKFRIAFLILGLSLVSTYSYAKSNVSISELANNKDTSAKFKKMTGNNKLPGWVSRGGTDSENLDVSLNGNNYVVLTSCKPHDCSAQNISVMYSSDTGKMIGAFTTHDNDEVNQKITWLTGSNELSVDEKTILFASLTGSLANHPESYNFK